MTATLERATRENNCLLRFLQIFPSTKNRDIPKDQRLILANPALARIHNWRRQTYFSPSSILGRS